MTRKLVPRILVLCFVFLTQDVFIYAQTANPPQPLKLDAAVELALTNYPAIKTVQAQAAAAKLNIDLARTAYLPRLDLLYQENRATRNNVFGAVLPQSVIPVSWLAGCCRYGYWICRRIRRAAWLKFAFHFRLLC